MNEATNNTHESMPTEPEVLNAPAAEEQQLPEKQYCVFRAGRERFCLHVLDVEEVVEWPKLTKLPLGPAFLMGIFNLRGSIVPIKRTYGRSRRAGAAVKKRSSTPE